MARLRSHEWPGNIRELVNVIRYCTLFTKDGLIGLDLVEDGIRNQQIVTSRSSKEVTKPPNPKSDEDMKRELVEALEATGGNKSEAARRAKSDRQPSINSYVTVGIFLTITVTICVYSGCDLVLTEEEANVG